MTQDFQALLRALEKNPCTYIGKTVTTEEVSSILQEVGNFISENIQRYYTVVVQGIGTFGVNREKLLVCQQPVKHLINQRPVFQLSHTLALKFRIKWTRIHYEASLPQKVLNPSVIAERCQLKRSKVILAMYELITFMERSLHCNKCLNLPISGVGTLRVIEDSYKMYYSAEFLRKVVIHDAIYVDDKK